MPLTAALPRSSLHMQFLVQNGPAPDLILYRDAGLKPALERHFPHRTLFLGRERSPGRSPRALVDARKANRAYYAGVRERLEPLGIERLILFLEGEPLERSILDWYKGDVELWEDGLSHYVDLTHPLWYGARGAVQWLAGFHPTHFWKRRIDRSRLTIRDRFEQCNLVLARPEPGPRVEEVLIVGSPLVDDGIIPAKTLQQGLTAITAAARPHPVRYLPHPREDRARLRSMLAAVPGLSLAPEPFGITAHTESRSYALYVAAVSTALLDLQQFERSVFVPGMFGLNRMHRILADWPHNPVAMAADGAALKARIGAIGL